MYGKPPTHLPGRQISTVVGVASDPHPFSQIVVTEEQIRHRHDVPRPPLRPSLREETRLMLTDSYDKLPPVALLKPHSSNPSRKLRLLSLDGGGVRGIGTLYILKHIMAISGAEGSKPCDYFDMIAGTSTGGLIAIMLGRLQMSIDECIQAYSDLSSKIFHNNRGPLAVAAGKSRYSPRVFETVIKEFIRDRTGDSDSLMMMETDPTCKVFVVAVRADDVNNGEPLHIRTYKSEAKEHSLKNCKIWKACRATTAAPTYFPSMNIGGVDFQDGGLGHNNPMCLLKAEAEVVFGPETPIICALSIGTGLVPTVDLRGSLSVVGAVSGDLMASLLKLVTNTEQHHLLARTLYNIHNPGCYFRFNVGSVLTDKQWVHDHDKDLCQTMYEPTKRMALPTLDEWQRALIALDDYKKMDGFVKICEAYITHESLHYMVQNCAKRLKLGFK